MSFLNFVATPARPSYSLRAVFPRLFARSLEVYISALYLVSLLLFPLYTRGELSLSVTPECASSVSTGDRHGYNTLSLSLSLALARVLISF